MSEETNETPEEQPSTEEAEAEVKFTQQQLNAIVAREVAKTARKVKKEMEAQMAQPKNQEPTAGTGEIDVQSIVDQVKSAVAEEFTGKISEMSERLSAKERESEFASAISGLSFDDDSRREMSVLFQHDRELFNSKIAKIRAKDQPPPKTGEFVGVGAPSPTPSVDAADPKTWSRDEIAVMKQNGTFLRKLNEYRNSLPGGGGGLFPAKKPIG